MLSRTKLSLLAVLSLTAAACGLKGPLYRPGEAPSESVTPVQSTETSKKKDNPGGSTQPGEQSAPPVTPPDPDRPDVPPKP
ncbi:MAG TPA: lipoprotein [Steroidobacteraceae bacterium]|nr:lipoprotein [Steroidobacteraceae bacterium]